MAISRVHFTSIPVRDQSRALEFYRDRLGMQVETDAPYDDDWRWIFLRIPGAETLIQFARGAEMTVAPEVPALCLLADDVDAFSARLQAEGVRFDTTPTDAPWAPGVRFSLFRDSEDNMILMQSNLPEGDIAWPT